MLHRPALLLAVLLTAASARAQPRLDAPCTAARDAFEMGLAAYRAGAIELARRAWTDAAAATACGPDAAYNLAILASETGDLRDAAARFVETLDRMRGWPVPDSAAGNVRAMRQLALSGLLNVGMIRLDRDSLDAAEATFAALIARDSLHRDAHANRAAALFRARRWADLRAATDRLIAFDPLSRDAHTMRFEALRGLGSTRAAARTLRTLRSLSVDVERIAVQMNGGEAVVSGTVQSGTAAPGTPLRLVVTLLSPDGPIATQTVTLVAPAAGLETTFTAVFPNATGATSYRYRQVGR